MSQQQLQQPNFGNVANIIINVSKQGTAENIKVNPYGNI